MLRELNPQLAKVTPHVGVWIETIITASLKWNPPVTPHVGVWIETPTRSIGYDHNGGHTSCRCVD